MLYKVHLKEDIRRINIDDNNYNKLITAIENRFSISMENYRITYTDTCGDVITIAGPDDLRDAPTLIPFRLMLHSLGYSIDKLTEVEKTTKVLYEIAHDVCSDERAQSFLKVAREVFKKEEERNEQFPDLKPEDEIKYIYGLFKKKFSEYKESEIGGILKQFIRRLLTNVDDILDLEDIADFSCEFLQSLGKCVVQVLEDKKAKSELGPVLPLWDICLELLYMYGDQLDDEKTAEACEKIAKHMDIDFGSDFLRECFAEILCEFLQSVNKNIPPKPEEEEEEEEEPEDSKERANSGSDIEVEVHVEPEEPSSESNTEHNEGNDSEEKKVTFSEENQFEGFTYVSEEEERDIATLLAMGFPRDTAVLALAEAGGNVAEAVETLLQ